MKISVAWINEILRTDLKPAELMDILNAIGFPVEGYENRAEALKGVVIGEVVEKQKHPKAI